MELTTPPKPPNTLECTHWHTYSPVLLILHSVTHVYIHLTVHSMTTCSLTVTQLTSLTDACTHLCSHSAPPPHSDTHSTLHLIHIYTHQHTWFCTRSGLFSMSPTMCCLMACLSAEWILSASPSTYQNTESNSNRCQPHSKTNMLRMLTALI